MNPLKQYTDLYKEHADIINAGSAGALNAMRPSALEALLGCHLPEKGSENYEQTDLVAMLAPDYGLNLNRRPLGIDPAAAFSCRVPSLSSSLYFLMGDTFARTEQAECGLPAGVTVCSLAYAAARHPELVARYYGKAAELVNPLVALNTLLAQDGVLIHVPAGVKVEKPLQLVSVMQGERSMMAVRRMLIIMEEGAEARLLCCDHTRGEETAHLALQTIEIFAGKGSRFDLYDIEESSRVSGRLSSLYIEMERDAEVLLDGITLFNGNTRNEYHCTFRDENAGLRLLGMGIEDVSRRLDNFTLIRHMAPRCHSDELMKYVVDDQATGAFCGRIYVAHGAEKTEAYQANRNMVVSDTARMYSKPQLEIYNDDVKCSHGTAIGRMDERQLFYMQQRGLSLPVAHTLLKQAFMSDVIEGVRLPALKDRLRMLVDMRFGSEDGHDCAACAGKI